MSEGIIWEKPPPPPPNRRPEKCGNRKYDEFRDSLREWPGRWALLRTWADERDRRGAASYVNNMRRAPVWGGFEPMLTRRGQEWAVYVRYTGESNE